MNKYAIKLINGKQPSYRLIYALNLVELEILKTYIEIHLKTRLIQASKPFTRASIFFNKKCNGSFHLYVDYQGLNNLIIKNQYLFLWIGEILNCLSQAKQFIQLDLTNAYHQIRI